MKKQILLFGIVMLLLAGIASATTNDLTGCSITPGDYLLFNNSGFNFAGADAQLDHTDIDSGTYSVFIENFESTDDNGEPAIYLRDAAGTMLQMLETGGGWQYHDGGALQDLGFPYTPNTPQNISLTVKIDDDHANFTVDGSLVTGDLRDATKDWDYIRFDSTGETTAATGVYIFTGDTCPVFVPAEGSNTINLSAPLPINESSFNVETVNFNTSANSSSEFNCSFYINDTLNSTTINHAAGTDVFVDANVTFSDDGEYNYLFGCTNLDNDTNTSKIVFFMDFEDPVIATDFLNYSVFFQNNLTAQFNFSDNILLHTFNISIDDKLLNTTTHIHEVTYQYNLSFNVTNLSLGVHNITVVITDGHTADWLANDYEWSNGLFNDYMRYDFVEGGYIKTELKDKSIFDEWTTKRLFDRYTQTLEPANPSDTLTLVEESDTEIFIVDKPGYYKGQWVIVGNHWKDYVLKGEPESEVSIKRINKYKVEVTISRIKNTERLLFESIGDLNIVEQIFPFITAGAEATFIEPALEFQTQTMTLRMNKTADLNTSAVLFYNGTEKTVTNTSFATYDLYSSTFLTPSIDLTQENISFYWQYEFFVPGANEAERFNFTQTVDAIGFDNCSVFTTVAINMTVKNESSSSAIIDNSTFIKGHFRAWKSFESNFTEFNLTWGEDFNSNYGLCIDPAGANFTIDAQLEYGADNFETKLYYFNDYSIDNVTNFLDLFLTDGTTQVTLTVKDFDDSVVEDAVIKVLSYDVPTDTSTTTEIVETDSNGRAFVQLVLNTEWYVFIVEVDGVIQLQTIPTKVTSSAKTLRIDLEDIRYFDRYDVTRGISHSLTWTNATKTFTFTWSDPSGDMADGCLKVSRRDVASERVLSDTCTTSTASTKSYIVTDNITDQTYVAVSYIKFADGESYILATLVQSFEQTFKKFGLTGIFMSFLLVLTLIGIGIWHPVVAVLLAIFGLIVTTILGIFAVSWGVLMGLIIMGGILIYRLTKN